MDVRPETPADHAAIRRVVTAAFGRRAEADLVEAVRRSPHYVPELALVAEVGGTVVGHVMVSTARLHGTSGERPVALLAPVAVDPGHQRRGIGSRLVHAVVDLADARGEPFVVLEGDPAYYGRLGFEPAGDHGIVLPLPDGVPSAVAQVRRLTADDPAESGVVVYPPAFDQVS